MIAAIITLISFEAEARVGMSRIDFPYAADTAFHDDTARFPVTGEEEDREEFAIDGRIDILLIGEDNAGDSRRSDTVLFVAGGIGNRNIRARALPRETIERFPGIYIHYYVEVDHDNSPKLVDLIGGADIYVGKTMKCGDNWGKLHIDIPMGRHCLDGKTALKYVRFRPEGERGASTPPDAERTLVAVPLATADIIDIVSDGEKN